METVHQWGQVMTNREAAVRRKIGLRTEQRLQRKPNYRKAILVTPNMVEAHVDFQSLTYMIYWYIYKLMILFDLDFHKQPEM